MHECGAEYLTCGGRRRPGKGERPSPQWGSLCVEFEFVQPFLESADLCLLALYFVQEQGTQNLILHRLALSIRRTGYKIGKDFGNLFGDPAVLDWFGAVVERLAIAEGDWAEIEDSAAGVAHVPDVFFETF
jgi:hypothetical protein